MTQKQTIENLRAKLKGLKKLDDKDKQKRVKSAKDDFRYAAQTYFPHHVSTKETSKFRNTIYKDIKALLKKHRKLEFEAYRGAAKTTLLNCLLPLWLMVICKSKKHAVLIGATIRLSKGVLEFIKCELENNERLINDFDIRQGDKWTEEEIICHVGDNKFKMLCYGAGTKIRGANWLGHRPDLIICDDIENDENVQTKSQREKSYNWFTKAILKLPARINNTYNIIVVGTVLHHDSLLVKLKNRIDFKSFSFPLVLQFPSNLDSKKPNLKEFLLDDSSLDKEEILKEYLTDKESFLSEYQNQPLSKDSATFGGYQTFSLAPLCDAYYIGIDPALGKSKGDYFAIASLGQKEKFYASVKKYKIKPTLMIDKILQLYLNLLKLGRPIKIAIETVQFQEFFKDTLDENAKSMGICLPIIEAKNTIPKELRIDGLSPHINRGDILVDEKDLLFIDELDTYPKSSHDDGLDALEMAWRIAKKPSFDYAQANKYIKQKREKEEFLKQMLDR